MKQILFVLSHGPGSTIAAQESFDALLAGSAFAEASALFIGNGVLQLITSDSQLEMPPRKNFNVAFSAMPDFDIHRIYCCAASFHEKGLIHQDLCIRPKLLQPDAVAELWKTFDRVLCF